jgi:excisionase family DNA binding protein
MTTRLTVPEVADRLKLSAWKVCQLIRSGELTAENYGSKVRPDYRIDERDLEAVAVARRVKVAGKTPRVSRRPADVIEFH